MAAPVFSLGSAPKKPRVEGFEEDLCIFYDTIFSKKHPAVCPDINRLQTLFNVCRDRNDEVGKKLIAHKTSILNGDLKIKYHRNCRSSYCSPEHVHRASEKHSSHASSSSSACAPDDIPRTFTRSQMASEFDWKVHCFICGEPCFACHRNTDSKRNWSMVETSIDRKAENVYKKVLAAAEEKADLRMITRLHGIENGDLVAVEARYHRRKNCLTHYISVRNILASKTDEKRENAHKRIITKIKEEYYKPIVHGKEVFLFTSIKSRFMELAQDDAESDILQMYSTQNLKKKLVQEWPDLCFIPRPGFSDLVCSASVSVGEALVKANHLAKVLQDVSKDEDIEVKLDEPSDSSVVHAAVGILRRRISQVKKLDGEYYSSQEMSLKAAQDFVDPLLLKALMWLTDDHAYFSASDVSDNYLSDAKYLSVACDIVSLATSVMSPKHLGLRVHLHHQFGSRKLIDDISNLGHCISYTELRHFLTSAAVHISSGQQPGPAGALIPPELLPKEDGGKLITAVGDNWDHNERTVDGKRTTHAMTTILVTSKTGDEMPLPRIKKVSERTFDVQSLPGVLISHSRDILGSITVITHAHA